MVVNQVTIPLSMLMTVALNNIETNQNVKYKWITYGSGIGKTFLDDTLFLTEDQLSDFEFSQAYINWLTLIKTVLDPVVEQGWHGHHKHMVLDRGFMEWAQVWHSDDCMLCSRFMLKSFILDVTNSVYEKQLE